MIFDTRLVPLSNTSPHQLLTPSVLTLCPLFLFPVFWQSYQQQSLTGQVPMCSLTCTHGGDIKAWFILAELDWLQNVPQIFLFLLKHQNTTLLWSGHFLYHSKSYITSVPQTTLKIKFRFLTAGVNLAKAHFNPADRAQECGKHGPLYFTGPSREERCPGDRPFTSADPPPPNPTL